MAFSCQETLFREQIDVFLEFVAHGVNGAPAITPEAGTLLFGFAKPVSKGCYGLFSFEFFPEAGSLRPFWMPNKVHGGLLLLADSFFQGG